MNNFGNPFACPGVGNNNIAELISQLQNYQYPQNAAMGQRGDFVEIKDDRAIDNFPARTDGMPTLFFNYGNMTFTSKKLVNGKSCQQTFQFAPLNAMAEEVRTDEEPSKDKVLHMLLDKMENMEKILERNSKDIDSLKQNKE